MSEKIKEFYTKKLFIQKNCGFLKSHRSRFLPHSTALSMQNNNFFFFLYYICYYMSFLLIVCHGFFLIAKCNTELKIKIKF